MTHDPSNPFALLAQQFALIKGNKKGEDSPGRTTSLRSAGGREAQQEREDSLLFHDTVRKIRPLTSKQGDNRGGKSLADVMKAQRAPGVEKRTDGRCSFEKDMKKKRDHGHGPTPVLDGQQPENADASRSEFLAAIGCTDNTTSHESGGIAGALDTEEENLFNKAMKGVAPMSARGRDIHAPVTPSKSLQFHDPAKALQDVLDGKVQFALHHTDEFLEGYVVGVDPLVLARLRAGLFSPEKHLDLHGMNARQAHEALIWFIKNAYQRGLRTVVVVTGRGRNSPDGVGVLRPLLQQWLCREPFKRVVLAFCTAKPHDGGPGAVYVLLRKYKKNRGKIVWERTPSEGDFPDL